MFCSPQHLQGLAQHLAGCRTHSGLSGRMGLGLWSSQRLWPAWQLQNLTSRMEQAAGCSPSLGHITRGQGDLAGAGVSQGLVVLEPRDSGWRVGFEHHLQGPAPVQLRELYSVQLPQQAHIATLCKGRLSGGDVPGHQWDSVSGGRASGGRASALGTT